MLPSVGPFEAYGMATVVKYNVCAQKIAQNISPLIQEPSSSSYGQLNKVCFIGKSRRIFFALKTSSKMPAACGHHTKNNFGSIFLSCVLPVKANSWPASVLTWKWRMVRLRTQDAVSTLLFFFLTRGCDPLLARDTFFTGSLLPFFISLSVIHRPKSSEFSTKNKITVHFDVDGRSVIVRQFPEPP